MNGSRSIVKKRLAVHRSRTIIMTAVFAILIATLFSVISISRAYAERFVLTAEKIGEEPSELAFEGVTNVSEFIASVAQQAQKITADKENALKNNSAAPAEERSENAPVISYNRRGFERSKEEEKVLLSSDKLFSPRSGYVNLPVYAVINILTVILCVRITVSIIFSVYEKERRRFFALLMISGANGRFIRSAARYEGLYMFAAAIPFGLLLGSAEIIAAKYILNNAFKKIGGEISADPDPLNIKISLIAALISLLIVMISILGVSKRACKKLYMKNASTEIRKNISANIGNRVFSAKEKSYKRLGIEHFVAMRNFSGGVTRYLKIFFLTAVCMGLSGISLMVLTISKNYFEPPQSESEAVILASGLTSHTFSCAVAFLLITLLFICQFCVITSNIETNIGEYMMMRSIGLKMRKIKRCASIEGRVCIIIGIVCGTFSIGWFWNYIMENYYLYQNNISFHGGQMIVTAIGIQILLYIAVSFAATIYSKNKIEKTNIIASLKDVSY